MSVPLRDRGGPRVPPFNLNVKYTKLHSPRMRSAYWKYFGFPTNEENRIITKQNVVCTICCRVLTNHRNTTNLRAHLQHRHKRLFQDMCSENNIQLPPKRRPLLKADPDGDGLDPTKLEPTPTKIKIEVEDTTDEDPNQDSGAAEYQSMLYDTLAPLTYDDDDPIDTTNFKIAEVFSNYRAKEQHYRSEVAEVDSMQLRDALVNMIVQDMRNVDTIYDAGLSYFMRIFGANLPSQKKIEALISELHSDKFTTLSNEIMAHSQIKPFSLGFEIWNNVESKYFLSIYYNYTTDAPNYNLLNQLYCTVEYNKFTSVDGIFEEFNLYNCTAAIVSYDYDDYLKQFLKTKNIPIILSCDTVIDRCLTSVFGMPEVLSIIEQVNEEIMRYSTAISSEDVEIPTINKDFPWTCYEVLKFFSETVTWPENLDILAGAAKAITDILDALEVVLDTLKGEEIPHSSMISPITSKIMQKLSFSQKDAEFVRSIKATVCQKLNDLVIANEELTVAALLDPRFHRLTTVQNLENCLQILSQRYSKMREQEACALITNKPSTSSERRSNLETFFDILDEEVTESTTQEKRTMENDLNQYRKDVRVDLDVSPTLWWKRNGHLYPKIKKLAPIYQCIPCVVNMNFKKPVREQVYAQQKRFLLTGNLIDAILFLNNHNKVM